MKPVAPAKIEQLTAAECDSQSERALIIKAKGGLGNRMLSGVTGLVLAHLTQRTPFIDWRDGMYVERGSNLYPLLFEGGWMGDLSQFDDGCDVAPALWRGNLTNYPTDIIRRFFPKSHQDPFIYRKTAVPLAGADPPERIAVFWSYLPKLERLKRRMAAHPEFVGNPVVDVTRSMLARYFKPVAQVTQKVEAIFADQTRPIIGVHIRFTDRKVPLPKLLAAIERLRTQEPDAPIFLATDSAEAEAAVLARFDGVLTNPKELARDGQALHVASGDLANPVEEARNALIDMMALSRCEWLVHSSQSTFSVTAALIGGIPPERQFDVDRFNPKVRLKQAFQARA